MNSNSIKKFLKPTGLALLLTVTVVPSAFAQRTPPTQEQRQESREERMKRIQEMTPEQRTQYFQNRMKERLANMTPEQRQQWEARQAQMENFRRQEQIAQVTPDDRQRYLMKSAGIEDTTVQDAIIAFVKEQAEKRQPVTEAGRALSLLLASADTAPEAFTAQYGKLQEAAKTFRTWKEGALKELDGKIGYSKNPRLMALLVLVSIVGDEGADAGGYNAMFPKGLAGDGDIAALLPDVQTQWGGGGPGGGGGGNNFFQGRNNRDDTVANRPKMEETAPAAQGAPAEQPAVN